MLLFVYVVCATSVRVDAERVDMDSKSQYIHSAIRRQWLVSSFVDYAGRDNYFLPWSSRQPNGCPHRDGFRQPAGERRPTPPLWQQCGSCYPGVDRWCRLACNPPLNLLYLTRTRRQRGVMNIIVLNMYLSSTRFFANSVICWLLNLGESRRSVAQHIPFVIFDSAVSQWKKIICEKEQL